MPNIYYAVAKNLLKHTPQEREELRKKIIVPEELNLVTQAFEELIREEETLRSNAIAEEVNNRIATYRATLPLSKKLCASR